MKRTFEHLKQLEWFFYSGWLSLLFPLVCPATGISFYGLSDFTEIRATVKYNPFHLQHRAFPLLKKSE